MVLQHHLLAAVLICRSVSWWTADRNLHLSPTPLKCCKVLAAERSNTDTGRPGTPVIPVSRMGFYWFEKPFHNKSDFMVVLSTTDCFLKVGYICLVTCLYHDFPEEAVTICQNWRRFIEVTISRTALGFLLWLQPDSYVFENDKKKSTSASRGSLNLLFELLTLHTHMKRVIRAEEAL